MPQVPAESYYETKIKRLHLITQRGQPYGSTRRCCERCGLMITGNQDERLRATEDEAYYERADEDRCDWKGST